MRRAENAACHRVQAARARQVQEAAPSDSDLEMGTEGERGQRGGGPAHPAAECGEDECHRRTAPPPSRVPWDLGHDQQQSPCLRRPTIAGTQSDNAGSVDSFCQVTSLHQGSQPTCPATSWDYPSVSGMHSHRSILICCRHTRHERWGQWGADMPVLNSSMHCTAAAVHPTLIMTSPVVQIVATMLMGSGMRL